MPEKKFLHLNEHGNSGKEVAATPKVWTKANQATPKKKTHTQLSYAVVVCTTVRVRVCWGGFQRGKMMLMIVEDVEHCHLCPPQPQVNSVGVCVCGFAGFQCSTPLKAVPRKFSPRSLLHRNNRKK